MPGLFFNNPNTPEGKYLVKRRDGSIPQWPHFVLAASDPAAPEALLQYADAAAALGYDPQYTDEIRNLAVLFEEWRRAHETGDPDAPPHRKDDPATIEEMRKGHSA